MGFREIKSEEDELLAIKAVEDMFRVLGFGRHELGESWEPTDEMVGRECEEPAIKTPNKSSITKKLGAVVHNTLDSLIAGELSLENAQELDALIAAIRSAAQFGVSIK